MHSDRNSTMSNIYQSLSHSSWDCKYHVVFIPKCRKKAIYGKIRENLGQIFHELARQKQCKIIEGNLVSDHVHMCIEIPPKYAVSSIIGFMKGKSAIAVARMSGKQRNFNGENFWARGYAVSTVGYDLEAIRKYIRDQEDQDGDGAHIGK
ncbi:MAG: Transposase IS200-family protein [Candidatus Uhrbacteria bacterium GW2011_GWF2_44_350]|uniref:Transposase IS200-family protein n=1 Tax=Candidatus Uhrbacteria bacterium GW2011_GWF2_44_350 TaxID=1619000 RepID=A0A0G1JDW1_9BACT|nr:MAG: Transposase IS200-family protein [Candidatus Uhrbacteria bacterium GW2011_GWF2_44_350]